MPGAALRYPVVLVHGLGGFDQVQVELLPGHPLRIHYFKSVARRLMAAGAPRVYTAALPPHGSIRERALALKRFIDEEVRETRFHLVAHSMGGLDAREYLTHLGGAAGGKRALSLTTLGTPHRGSPLATIAVERLVEPCAQLIKGLGLERPLHVLLAQTAAHRDLRPEACAAFNERTPDAPSVTYFSWAGDPAGEAVHWVLRGPWHVLHHCTEGGANDGLVTTESARWSGWRGVVPADHLSLAGWQFTPTIRRHFRAGDFYVALLDDLRQAELAG